MSVADRMVVRTRDGEYRSVPRRTALAMISVGRAQAAGTTRPSSDDETPTVVADVLSVAPATRERPSKAQEHPVTPSQIVDAATHGTLPDVVDVESPEYSAALEHLGDASGLFEEDVPTVEAVPLPAEPRANASRGKWLEYAVSLGVEVTDELTRNDIRDAAHLAAQSLTHLPQPAVTDGGRLETPEDEPVTEGSVTDDEDSGTR